MNNRARPLEGIRVLEMGRLIAAPFCAQILGDLGADVIKLERAGPGDLGNDDSPGAASVFYLSYNRNKRSVAVDFSKPEGADLIRSLAAKSDVFIENFKVGGLKKYGLDEAGLRAVNPELIYLSVSGFGQGGPYASRPATDVAVQGMSGLMSITGEPDGPPSKVGVSIIDMVTGLYGVIAIVSALYRKMATKDPGSWAAVSLLDCGMSLMGAPAITQYLTGVAPLRAGNLAAGNAPSGLYPCRNGELLLQAGKDADFVKLCRVLGLEALATDPRFERKSARVVNCDELNAILIESMSRWDRDDLYNALIEGGLIVAPVNNMDQALADPQVNHNGNEVIAGHPEDAGLKLITSPIRFDGETPPLVRYPPRVGEHTAEVLKELLGMAPTQIEALAERGVVELMKTRGKALSTAE
jgi:crotonobetainyl-CoA:carnitine CoA-transferase CaiB-like acyl-CoA transferase